MELARVDCLVGRINGGHGMEHETERHEECNCMNIECTFFNSEHEQNCGGMNEKSGDPGPAFCRNYFAKDMGDC